MTRGERPRLTWSRLGIGVSIVLVLFGVIDAHLPHSGHPIVQSTGVGSKKTPASGVTAATTPVSGVQDNAALRVAEDFVEATGTTDPNHPEGDTVEQATVAPALPVPERVVWPEAWVAEDRRTTVELDPPGPLVGSGSGQVAVVVTGRTVVTTDVGPPSEVPVDERITLRLMGSTATPDASYWVVTDVGSGS